MHVGRRNGPAAEVQGAGGAGVVRDEAFKAVVGCRPDGGIHAHVRHHSGDGEALDLMLLE